MNRRELIGNVRVRKTAVYVGEPLAVKVITLDEQCEESIQVTITGSPGKSQYLQFKYPGRKKISVMASTRSQQSEQRTLEVEVLPRPNECDGKSLFPIIGVSQNFLLENGAAFHLENAADFNNQDVYYVWELGDGVTLTSARPILNYSFEDRLDANAPYTNFNVRLHVKTHDNQAVYSGQRTVAVWNTYYLNKRKGFIQLKVRPEIYARREDKNYVGHFTVVNLEAEPIQISSYQVEYLFDDPEKMVTPGQPNSFEWKIGAKETQKREFSLPVKGFPKDAFGFAIHFRGRSKKKLLTFADVYFEIRTNHRTARTILDLEFTSILAEIRGRRPFLNSDIIPLDRLQKYLAEQTDCEKKMIRRPTGAKANADWINEKVFEFTGDVGRIIQYLDGDLEGQECTPEDEDNPRDDLVCQLTNEWKWVIVPARILNARKGDVILSPGGNGAIGGLLKQVSPPQVYSHSGIMINNYYRLRHSTASEDWLEDAAAGTAVTGDKGTEGLDPDKLKYAWPGTIDQSIEEAFNGSYLNDPDGLTDENGDVKRYKIKAFSNETKYVENIGLVEPVVVKPDPLVEAELPQVREWLHRVADSARQVNGHYRFYCYTNADIYFDDFYRAPDRGAGWWASNTRPTVCSSMIWAAIKRLEEPIIMLEGRDFFTQPSDLEPSDVGAQVDFRTRDGLYYYTEAERRSAGNWLYDHFYNIAYDKAGFLGNLFSDAADDLASQVVNTFAFDWSGEDENGNHAKDSDRWQNPGDGRAVSPDNIKDYWDAPAVDSEVIRGLYGYSEKLLYRPARLEYRRVSRWVRVEKEATLRGRVLYRGNPVAGAVVKAAGRDRLSNGSGEFELTIPAGSYRVEAGKLINGWFVSTHQDVTLAEGEERAITLILEEPDELFREVTVRGSMYIVDDEWGSDETATRNVFMSGIRVGPFGTHAERSQTEKMGGEVRVEMRLRFDWQLDASVNVWYEVKLFEGTSEETNDLEDTKTGTINAPKDRTVPLTLRLVNTEFDGGDTADINLQISNDRQP